MKILKIFGVVVGIHLFALILIFATPACTSTTKPAPAPSDTMARNDAAMSVSVPNAQPSSTVAAPTGSYAGGSATIAFNPDAPAVAANSSGGVRFTPTRPNTPAASTLIAEPVTDVTPATTYTVVSGDSLWSISKKVHASTTEIAAANNLKTNAVLKAGQKLLIPGKPGSASAAAAANPAASAGKSALTVAPTPKPSAEALHHVVKSGETLSTIAKQYGVKQADIAMANNITDPAKIRAGMEIIIPGWQTPVSKSGKKADTATKSGSKSTTPPTISIGEPEPPVAPKPAASDVPVIQIDDTPVTPAPKK